MQNTNPDQQSLFGGIPAPQPVPVPDPMQARHDAMTAAFEHADEVFREKYEELVIWFAGRGIEFIGEDVQNEYKRRSYLPQPREWRATGAIYLKLKRRGVIRQIGFRARNQGNPTPTYKGVRINSEQDIDRMVV